MVQYRFAVVIAKCLRRGSLYPETVYKHINKLLSWRYNGLYTYSCMVRDRSYDSAVETHLWM